MMIGIRTILKTNSGNLKIHIPDILRNKELEIIILPVAKNNAQNEYEFWSDEELQHIGKLNLGGPLMDKEDYTKC